MDGFLNELTRNLASPLSNLILQILVVLIVARAFGITTLSAALEPVPNGVTDFGDLIAAPGVA